MPSPSATPTPITPPRVPLIDARTGLIDRAWYMFFVSLYREANTIIDTNIGPDSGSLIASYAAELEALAQAVGTQFNAESMLASLEIAINVLRDQHDLLPPPETGELQQQIDTLRQEVETLPRPPLGTMSQLQQSWLPWVTFDTAPEFTPPDVGTLAWDGGTTLGVQMTTNVLGRINESGYYYVKASSAITKGDVVMFTGAVGASGVPTGAPATGVTDGSYIMGVAAESIALNGFGLVQFIGTLRGVDLSAYADGDILWYNPAVTGGLTKTKPSAPNVKVQMAAVISASNNGTMLIRVSPGSVLGGTDSNVQFGALSTGDLIQYDATLGYWKNVASTSAGVTSFSAGTTGLTPSSPTTGNVVLAGTLAVANGGTGTGTAGIGAFNNITGYTATGATGTTSTKLVFSTNPTITNLVVNGYQYIENSTTYNLPANAIQEIGASNDTSVNNGAIYRWRWIVEGDATNQNLVLYAYRRATTTIEEARFNSAGFSLPTGQAYQINGTTVLSGSALGSGITGSSLTSVGTITSGTWNGTAIANAYLANSSITINGSSVSLGGSVTVTSNTTNSLTFNNGGSGDASGTTFNGSAAKTISYNTVGASPLAGSTSLTTLGTVTTGTWNATAIGAAYGGTGQTTYTIGDLLYASGTTTLSKLADVATGNALISGGVGVAPSWGKVGLTTHVSGTLPIANGGTNATATPTAGGVAYGTGSAYAFTAAGTSNYFLQSAGSGAPTWSNTLNGVSVGATTASTGSFTTLQYSDNLTSTANGLIEYNKSVSVSSGVSTNVFTIDQNGYLISISGTVEIWVFSSGYPDGEVYYQYTFAAHTAYGNGSFFNSGNQTLETSKSSSNGFSVSAGPTWTWTKTASASNGKIVIALTTNNSCSVLVRFKGHSSGATLS